MAPKKEDSLTIKRRKAQIAKSNAKKMTNSRIKTLLAAGVVKGR